MDNLFHKWECPRCKTIIGDDCSQCSLCKFIKEPFVKEKETSQWVRNFIRGEIFSKKGHGGKPRKTPFGMRIVNPYVESHTYLRDCSPRYIKKVIKDKNK